MHLSESDWAHIGERAQDFVGRAWVFERVRAFLASDARMLVIVAPPGSGKTAIAARLAQASADRLADEPELPIPANTFAAALFCRAGRVTLLEVAQDLGDQLSAALGGFAAEQRSTVATQVTVSNVQVPVAGDVSGSVTGVKIDLAPLGPEGAFANGLALPLRRLSENSGFRPPVLLVDSLDEAYASPAARTLPTRLAADLVGARLILTTRDHPRVLVAIGLEGAVAAGHAVRIHLTDDAPAGIDEVADYAAERLRGRGTADAVAALAGRIGEAAEGNFLYAYHVVGGQLASAMLSPLDTSAAADLPLPVGGLAGVYRDFVGREMAGDEERWSSEVRPVLAPLVVALGDGLDTTQLAAVGTELAGARVSRSTTRDVTRRAGQFLQGPRPDGPFRVYHRSFAEFLLENPDWPVDAAETHAAIVDALVPRGTPAAGDVALASSRTIRTVGPDWSHVTAYATSHLATHAARAGMLDALLVDPGFLLAASPHTLVPVLSEANRADARAAGEAFERVLNHLAVSDYPNRGSFLWLSALQVGAVNLFEMFADGQVAGQLQADWEPRWVWWRRQTPSRVVGRLGPGAQAIATIQAADAQIAVIVGVEQIEVWDLSMGLRVASSTVGAPFRCVATAASGPSPVAIAGSQDGSLRVLSLPELTLVGSNLSAHDHVLAITAIDGADLVASGGDDGRIAIWTLPLLEPVRARNDASGAIYDLASVVVGDGTLLVSGGDEIDSNQVHLGIAPIRVWSVPELELMTDLAQDVGLVQDVGVVAMGRRFIVLSTDLGHVTVHSIGSDGSVLWTGTAKSDRHITRTDFLVIREGEECEVAVAESGRLHWLNVRADVDPPVSAFSASVEVEPGDFAGPVDVHGREAIVSASDTLRIWDLANVRPASPIDIEDGAVPDEVPGVQFLASASGTLAGSTVDRHVRRWGARGDQFDAVDAGSSPHSGLVALTPRKRPWFALAHADGKIDLINPRRGVVRGYIDANADLQALAVGSLGGRAVIAAATQLGMDEGRKFYGVRLWDAGSAQEIDTRRTSRFAQPVDQPLSWKLTWTGYIRQKVLQCLVAFGDGSRLFVAAGNVRGVVIWDVNTNTSTEEPVDGGVTCAAASEDTMVTGSGRGLLTLWQAWQSGVRPDSRIIGHHASMRALLMSSWHGSPAVVSGGDDGWLRLWSIGASELGAVDVGAPIRALAALPHGEVALGTTRGVVVLAFPALAR